jgi:hypothetical protein
MAVQMHIERLSDDDIKKYAGQWVAVKGGTVLVAADLPARIVDWIKAHNETADLIYKMPAENEPAHYF